MRNRGLAPREWQSKKSTFMRKIPNTKPHAAVVIAPVVITVTAVVLGIAWLILFAGSGGEPIRIGAIISLTGPGGPAIEGIGVRDGMRMAIEEINDTGGVNGSPLELIVRDPGINPEQGEKMFDELEEAYRPLLFISTHSSVSRRVAELAEQNNVVLLTTLATDPGITMQKEWVFRYWPTAKQEVPLLMNIAEDLELTNVGVLYVDDEFGRSVANVLREQFEAKGAILEEEPFSVFARDFTAPLNRLQSAQGLFIIGFSSHLEEAFLQARDIGFNGALFSTNGATSPPTRSLAQMDGVYVTAPIIYNPDFLPAKALRTKYESEFATAFNHYVASGYDMIQIIASLLEDSEFSRSETRERFEGGFVHPGIFGTLQIRAGEHDISFPLYSAQIQEGRIFFRYAR